ncbi:hypothetical protein Trydic_g20935 [Trypoxylus dichotomus]
MSKVSIILLVSTIIVSSPHYAHPNIVAKDNPYLVQFCMQPDAFVACYGVYIHVLYVLEMDPCIWRLNFALFPENDMVMGSTSSPCKDGEHRKPERTYIDSQSLKYSQIGIAVVKLKTQFTLGKNIKVIDVNYFDTGETECHIYEITYDEPEYKEQEYEEPAGTEEAAILEEPAGTEEAALLEEPISIKQDMRKIDIKIGSNTDCYERNNDTDKDVIIKCAPIAEDAVLNNSPVICQNKLYGFVFEAYEGQAKVYLIASQANWISITVTGKTLKAATTSQTSVLKVPFSLIVVNIIVLDFLCMFNTML